MSFADCIKNFNWLTIIVICILATAFDVTITTLSQSKRDKETAKELSKIQEIKEDVELMRDFLISGRVEK